MKKLLFAIFAACSLTAMADDYNYLEVEQKNGTTLDISLNTLRRITFVGSDMVVEDVDGQKQSVALAQLQKLYFSASPTPVVSAKADEPNAIEGIYTVDGRRLSGKRTELLQGGVYIVKKADGSTVKITRK